MKRILFTAAVEEELMSAKLAYDELFQGYKGIDNSMLSVDFIVTGVGTTGTSYHLTKSLTLPDIKYDLVVNVGIAGSFTDKYPLGSVVSVTKEQFGDVGIESRFGFQTLFQYEILDANTIPFRDGALYSPYLSPVIENAMRGVPKVSGITNQTISGSDERNKLIQERFHPDIESMEGAAVFYVSIMEKVPFMELRGISNKIGERDKSQWETQKALSSLKETIKDLFRALVEE